MIDRMAKIWLLTDGMYSDYHVVGVFTDKALADEAAKLMRTADVEEFDVTEAISVVPELTIQTVIRESAEAPGVPVKVKDAAETTENYVTPLRTPPSSEGHNWASVNYNGDIIVTTRSIDFVRARKVHTEQVAQCVAEFDLYLPDMRRHTRAPKVETSIAFIETTGA